LIATVKKTIDRPNDDNQPPQMRQLDRKSSQTVVKYWPIAFQSGYNDQLRGDSRDFSKILRRISVRFAPSPPLKCVDPGEQKNAFGSALTVDFYFGRPRDGTARSGTGRAPF
jgi:hypothetical protein